jgi:hypothetical protein
VWIPRVSCRDAATLRGAHGVLQSDPPSLISMPFGLVLQMAKLVNFKKIAIEPQINYLIF